LYEIGAFRGNEDLAYSLLGCDAMLFGVCILKMEVAAVFEMVSVI
jgi:hypothetical protein